MGNRPLKPWPKISKRAAERPVFGASRAPRDPLECRKDKERRVPRLSIVIPCLGGAADFDATLVSVLQNRPGDCEVLVAHSEPYDDPYRLHGEVHFIHVEEHSTVGLLNA